MRIKYFIFILIFFSTISEISSQSAGDLKFKQSFTPGTASQRQAKNIAYQSDGKIVMIGWDGPGNNTTHRFTAIRLKTNGTEYDSTFGTNGIAMYDIQNYGYPYGLAIQDDGKIVIAGFTYDGSAYDGTVIRINSDGTLDTSFSGDGIYIQNETWRFYGVTIQNDGKIVAVGYENNVDPLVVRFNSNGTLDTSFGSNGEAGGITIKGDDYWYGVQLDANQKIVLVGRAYWSSKQWFTAGRLNTDGSWDTSFDSDGRATYDLGEESQSKAAYGLDFDSNGKILISGTSQGYPTVIRLNTDGSLDTSFDSDGIAKITAFGYGNMKNVFALSNGKIAAAGDTQNNNKYDFSVIMFNSNGSLDTDYGDATNDFGYSTNGLGSQGYAPTNDNDYAHGADMKSDGTILIGGADTDGTYLWGAAAYIGYTPDAPYFIDEYPSLTSTAGTTASISVKINEAGKVYYVLLANGATFPTVAEVRAATGNGGANALQSGNQSVSANTAATISLSSLSTQTSYDLFIIAEDNEGTPNLSDIVKKIDITTLTTTVTSITSTSSNASYKIGDVIPITVNFSENVTVSGTPQLTLETGSTDAVLNYSSGSSSNALVFNYTLASGHASSDLDYQSTSALALNSGTINDGSNNAATLTLPSPGATNSLGANKALVIDGIVPTISSVSSSTNNGTYKIGNTIAINVTFSELVNVVTTNGTPRIKLETGSTDQYAAYFSGSGSTILTFSYTVQSGDASSDLDYQSTSALELNSGTIKDGAGNSATLTLVNPGTSNSLGVNKSIVIDGVIPTVTFSPTNNATGVQLNSNITLTFSEAVRKIDDSALSDTNVDALITLKNSNSSGSDIAFDATINSGKTIITINPSNDFSSEQVVYVAIGATVEDGAGNAISAANATFTGADVNATVVTFSPANGASNVSTSGNVTISFNEAVRKIDDSELTNNNVDALITLKDSNSSGSDIAFDATINSGKTLITINPTNDFSSSQVVYVAIGAILEDDSDNAITAISTTFTVSDILSPTIAAGSISSNNSYIDVTMNEGVYNTNSGSGALEKTDFTLTFDQNSGNATATSINSIKNNSNNALSGGESVIRLNLSITGSPSGVETVTIVPASSTSIYDASGNAMATTQTNEAKTLNDKLAPVFASEYPSVANVSGTSFDILVKINEGGKGYYVVLANDATAPTATEVKAGTGSSAATAIKSGNFVLAKDTEKSAGITGLTSETNYDIYIVTEDGEPTPNAQIISTKLEVKTGDITSPVVSNINSAIENAIYTVIGDTIPITITFSEDVIVTGTPQLTIETGINDALANYNSGTGTDSLTFHYIIAIGDTSSDLSYVSTSSLVLNSGTIKDGSGNPATLGLPEPGTINTLSSNKNILIDALLPTVLSVSSTAVDSVYGVGSTIPITVLFSEKVKVEGIPQVILSTGTIGDTANYVSGSTANILTFNYSVSQADNSSDLDYKDEDALILNNGTIKDLAGNDAQLKLVAPGLENSLGANKQLIIDTSGPIVLSVTSITNDGIFKIGDTVNVSINFNEPTYVSGNPQIKLATGTEIGLGLYSLGSGTKSLSYNYIIQTKHFSVNLSYTSINAFELNNATLKDSLNNDALLTLPEPGSDNSLSKNKSIIIDGIVPSIPWVYEGSVSTDLDYQNDPSNLTLTWGEAEDAFFDTMHYEYSIGITKGGTEIKGWTNSNGKLSIQLSDLNLIENVTYYSGVKAIDGAGNISPVLQSDGITIDKTSPLSSSINDGLNEDIDISNSGKTISANWLQFIDATSFIKEYEYAVGTTANGIDVKTWTSIGVDTSFVDSSFQLIHAQNYFVSVKATDAANNVSKKVSSDGFKVDLYPGAPSVSSISLPNGSYLPLIADIAITVDFSESISDYELSMSSKLNNSVNNSHSKDVNQINLNIIAPLTSLDTLSLTISNVTDLVGNVSDNIEYQFPTSLIGDFTGDQSIDASDILPFVTGWNNKDITYELGPVVGKPPHFTIQKDGKYDLRDLMALTRIWDWSQASLSKLRARQFEQIGDSINHNVLDKNISLYIPTKVSAIDLFIDYPIQDVKFDSLGNITTPQKVFLSHHDTTNSLIKITSAFMDSKSKTINLPYRIVGKENVPIKIDYRMLDQSGYIIGQGETTIQLIAVPQEFLLHQNYPNPFNPTTSINFDLPNDAFIKITVYDINGRLVTKLYDGFKSSGYHTILWDSRNQLGGKVAAGIYFYQLQSKEFVKTRKMILLK